jgi:DNA topoisomerase-1
MPNKSSNRTSAKYLVIVESPGKIKKLKHILGRDYDIIASMGHVVDLPPKEFGIDVSNMRPKYVTMKADVAKRLKASAQKGYDTIYLAADPDREGEAIAHHVANLLKRAKAQAKIVRVTFDAITPSAVQAAFKNPRTINQDLVHAQEARRLLDRLVGFPASRFVWQHVTGKGLSAGRVQSVALRLVVVRDHEIATFVPEEYWTITGHFRAQGGDFQAKLQQWRGKKSQLKSQADAQSVLDALQGVDFKIGSVTPKRREKKAPAPFVTSSLQQAASSHLKIAPETTMKLAQMLYENGFITYMRTDSPAVSPEGQHMAREHIAEHFGDDYIGKGAQHRTKGKAQEAHECIRPTDVAVKLDAVRLAVDNPKAIALYDLIQKRFLASQMANAIFDEVHVTVLGGEAVFATKGSRLAFDGFLRVYNLDEEREAKPREDAEDDDDNANQTLPPLKPDEPVKALKLVPKQHFTKPPAHYSEALLVKALEKHGVGRPSTFAQTVATLKKRQYVKLEKRRLHATDLGKQVHRVLDEHLTDLFAVAFTAQMETTLDAIAEGKQDSRAYLKQFWADVAPRFGEAIVAATLEAKPSARKSRKTTKTPKPVDPKDVVGECPTCGRPLVKRKGKHGDFVGCSGFPKCRYTRNL